MLARTLGRTLEELEESMTAAEFGEWFAYYELAPWCEFPARQEVVPDMDPMGFAKKIER